MNQKMRKILSFALALCMLLTNASLPVFAAEGDAGATTTNGSYDASGNWVEGGSGSATYDVDGTNVTLSKTATPTGNENEFLITLQVSTSTTTTTYTDGGAVVLVIDVSGSMKYCADCGGNGEHENDCDHYTRWNNNVSTAQSRMNAAKIAATNFLSSYAGNDPNTARMVAIVSFQSSATTRLEWVNVAGKQHDYQTALNTINALSANGGTNLDDGLYHALAQLNSDTVKDFSSKNVIALTDGAPTRSRTAGDGTRGSATINSHTAAQATNVKNTGTTLYTVCFGVANEYTYNDGPTVGNFLSGSVASSGCAYNADNSSELYSVFAAITNSITSGLSGLGWTATDPMADMIEVNGGTSANFSSADGKTYTWTLADAKAVTNGNVTTYTYTYTYTVKLNVQGQNFEEGKFFPTNERTYLNLGEGKTLEFPVPGVKGRLPRTDVSVTKVWDDANNQDGIRATAVTVQLMEGERTIGEPVVLNADNNWTYTWNGEEYNLIAMSKGATHVYTVKELDVPKDYTASVNTNNFAITVTNTHEVYKTAVEVTKVWNDQDNQDGKRPASITVHLFANGEEIASAELTAAGSWKHVFDGLDLNANGKPVEYTVTEDSVPGYTTKIDGYVVTNTHEVEKTAVKVSKVWDDANNQDGKRTEIVTIRLLADGVDTGKTLTLSEATGWSGSFTELDKYSNAKEIKYTVSEDAVPGYTAAITGNQTDGYTVTNSHTPELINLSGSKTWKDADNQDGVRPGSITVRLLANGTEVASRTVSAPNWSWSFENMPKYAGGKLITYTVTEDAVDGYTPSYDGLNITNTHTPDQTFVEVTKIWNDAENQDGKRPEDITIVLLADGADTGKKLVLNAANGWHGVFENLDVNKNGVKIAYTVKEIEVAEYETEIEKADNGYTITNTHTPETVEVSGAKTWDDANNQDGKRPASITINLLADGMKIDSKTVTAADGWKWTFENLPKYAAGKEIVYSITENEVENYSTTYDGNNVINSYTPEQTSITVNKIWQDNNDQDDIRPEKVTVILLANGEPNGKELVLTEIGKWTGTFTELPVYANGQKIVYTIEEIEVSEYKTVIDGYTITNTHIPYVTEVSGAKTWEDNNNQDGKRPASITINLLANGVKVDSKTVNAADGWKWSFTDLPVNENGEKITYTITEDAVEEYTTEINGYNVTNTHAPEKTSVTVTKSWQDNNDQDGLRSEDVIITLLANNVDTGKTLVLNSGNNWSATFSDLDKYENGQEIVYTVTEKEVPGYNTVITGSQENGYTVTNSHTPETTTVSGAKTWADNDNQDGFRPASITINLLANGKVIQTLTVTAEDGWAWTFENLPKYENHGTLIEYTITEAVVEDYSTTYNGFNVTNTHTPEQTSVTVTKSWQDNNDQDGIRPNSITVILLANNEPTDKTLILSEGNHWTGSFTELDKFANGQEIKYTVAELEIEGYSTTITGSQANGYTITNSHNPETVVVSGAKTWIDAENQDGKRPESITINLLADGEVVKTITVTEADGWAWSFDNLPKYRDHGTDIVYTVTENAVEEYTTEINGYDVTNTHAPEKTSVNVIKAWEDSNNQDGIRPADVTVVLLANGEETEFTLVLSEGNNWNGTFADLDKYENGEVIVYEVAELTVDGYNSVISGDQNNGYKITNSHTPEVITVSGAKTWDDKDNQDGFRPESITINLLADGEIINTIEVTEETEWTWTFENLPKYRDQGTEIVYSITENAIDDYSAEYDGFNVTNTHTPEQTSVSVTKSWQDNDDQDGIRPEDITVILLANGEATGDELVLNVENNWTGSFTELDVYAEGEKIVYTVEEIEIEGYETVITGDQTTGFQVTNSHTPEVIEISGSKTWDDANNQDGKRPESITVNLLANGKVVKTATVTEAEDWSYTFENLPKYENGGNEIIYAITEDAVEGYTTTYDGYDITNSYTPMEISLTVTKAWADSDDEDGLRPSKVTILLYANGEKVDEKLVLNAKNNWSGSFVGLPKYANGEEIVYTIGEVSVKGYNTVIRGSMEKGFVVTNSHTVIPQTGDERTPILWMLMMLGSAAVVAYVGFDRKRRMAK